VIPSVQKIDALVAGITRIEVEKMPAAQRVRLAQVLRYVADLADPPTKAEPPTAGVLARLHGGDRSG
jgi:hypothetical protein